MKYFARGFARYIIVESTNLIYTSRSSNKSHAQTLDIFLLKKVDPTIAPI